MPKFKQAVDSVLRTICIVLFAVLVLLVCWQILTRLVFNDPSVWSEEASRYTFIWLSLIGISVATGERADVAIDLLVRKIPVVAQRWVTAVAYLSSIAFATVFMVYGGYLNAVLAWNQSNPILPVKQGVLYLGVPVAGILLTFYLGYHFFRIITAEENVAAPEEMQVEL
ncbi:TRAP-type C4-dicarboxylate transport system permease small subunit [Arthrobacter sp. V4I6]|uniref:TRAP transporter small permease n=1 Tax=unclassified Arthrobacter TaxID=235627 RepID=UPI0027865A43|nr:MULTISPECIES: TRAP transporter small permease [unclassified Arthrobacter]MDQ0823127.1 TRAP-type C4-dicarboxylate transport system permease small subunit [Arthrobacter sp. V1I7]MDQ0852758.1 TRAP-type C4-dicarboxylate transport system permease small subunit [Arthrobacter sp. V4I6]